MPGNLRNAVLGAVAATIIAGCGGDDGTIPQDNADDLVNRLDAIQSNVEQGDCTSGLSQAEGFKDDVNALPAPVDDEVKQGLQQAADQLLNLTANDCEPETGATDSGGAVATDSATETTEEPETTETTEEPETTETTEEPETTETTEEPEATEPQEDEQIEPPTGNPGQGGSGGVGSDGGIGPGAGRGGAG